MELFLFIILFALALISWFRGMKKQNNLRRELERENIVRGYLQFLEYGRDRLPVGGLSINFNKFLDKHDSPRIKSAKLDLIKAIRQSQIAMVCFFIFILLEQIF